jgi:hypothetical protein
LFKGANGSPPAPFETPVGFAWLPLVVKRGGGAPPVLALSEDIPEFELCRHRPRSKNFLGVAARELRLLLQVVPVGVNNNNKQWRTAVASNTWTMESPSSDFERLVSTV